jgi:hypothetical protein
MGDEDVGRTFSMFGGKKKDKVKLPPNWKKAKDKDGSVYYFNSLTQQRSTTVPPFLPKGWREAVHKDSGRVYYYNKETRESTFEFPTEDKYGAGGDDDDDDDDEPAPAPEGFFGRTISKFTGRKKDGIERTGTMSRSQTLTKKKKAADADAAKKDGGSADGAAPKTVFISCSTLIKEVKLCVGPDRQAALDDLYEKLTNHTVPANQAVRMLMEMVGSTVVQQAGLSVMNAQKGVLPHGWLEYTDEASGRPYFFNVHTKVTTWYKPTGAVPPPPPHAQPGGGGGDGGGGGGGGDGGGGGASGEEMMINFDCTLETHSVAMTGFI